MKLDLPAIFRIWLLFFLCVTSLPAMAQNYGLQFDGADDYVEVPDASTLDITGALTLEAWVRIDGVFTDTAVIVSKWEHVVNYSYFLGIEPDLTLVFGLSEDGNTTSEVFSYYPFQDGRWYHLAAVFEPSVAMRLYVNGQLLAEQTSGVPSAIYSGAAPLVIGNFAFFSELSHFGAIDEVKVWNTNLSETPIETNMFQPLLGTESNLQAYYDFEAGSGTVVADKTANNNDGALRNGNNIAVPADGLNDGPLWIISEAFAPIVYDVTAASPTEFTLNWLPIPNASGLRLDVSTDPAFGTTFITNVQLNNTNASSETIPTILLPNTKYYARLRFEDGAYTSPDSRTIEFMVTPGSALQFDGVDDYVVAGYMPFANNSFTIETWAKRDNLNPGNQYLFSFGIGNPNLGLHVGFADDDFIFNFWANDLTVPNVSTDTYWHHWAVSYDANTNTRIVYRDGINVGSDNPVSDFQNSDFLQIGRYFDNIYYFPGSMDEVVVWDYAKTDFSDRFTTRTGNEAGLLGYYRFDEGIPEGDNSSIEVPEIKDLSPYGGHGEMTGFTKSGTTSNWVTSQAVQPLLLQMSPSSANGYVVNWIPTQFGDVYFEVDDVSTFAGAIQYRLGDGNASATALSSFLTPNTKQYGRIFATDGLSQTPYSNTVEFMVGAGNALDFDGADDKVDVPGLALPATNFTIEAWANPASIGSFQTIFSASSTLTPETSLSFGLNATGNPYVGLDDGTQTGSSTDSRSVSATTWTHLALTFDGTNYTFYINGAAGTPGTSPANAGPLENSTIGAFNSSIFWSGAIDELKVWNYIKTDFSGRFNGALGNESGLLAYYRFDEETGTVLPDLSGNGLDGDWTGPSGTNTTATWVASAAMQSTLAPTAPSNLLAYTLPGDEVRLEWQDNSNDETGFYTQVSTAYSTGFSDYVAVGPNATQTTVGLNPDEGSFFRVRAFNNAGNSYSPVEFATTVSFPAYALQLDGTDDFISVPHDPNLNIAEGNFTLEAWVHPLGNLETVMSKGNGNGGALPEVFIFQVRSGGSNSIGLNLSDGASAEWGYSNTTIPLNQWSHVAVTYNSSTQLATFYLNGQADGTHTFTITPSNNSVTSPLFIGKQGSDCNCNYFGGFLDEVRIWNDEFFSLPYVFVPLQGSESNLVAYYPFDENTGINTVDRSPNTHDGQLSNGPLNSPSADGTTNGPIWSSSQAAVPETPTNLHARIISDTEVELTWQHLQTFEDRLSVQRSVNLTEWTEIVSLPPGQTSHIDNTVSVSDYYFYRVIAFADISASNPSFVTLADVRGAGNALAFNGSTQNVFAADDPLLDLASSFTIESWVYINEIPVTDFEGIVSKWNADGNERSYGLAISTAGELVLALSEDGISAFSVSSNQILDAGRWYHVAATYTAGASVRLYIDGVLDHEETAGIPAALFAGNANLVVGGFGTSVSPSSLLNASIDELRIWNTARLEADIQQAMFSKLIGAQGGLVLYYGFDEHESAEIKDLAGSNDASFTNMSGTEFTSSGAFNPVIYPATEVDLIGFRANWLPVPDATGYIVYLATNPIFESPDVFALSGTSGTEFVSTSLSKGQTYYYRISYETDFGAYSSNWSEYQTFSLPSHNALFFDGVDDAVILSTFDPPSIAYTIEAFINSSSANPLQTILGWGGGDDFFVLRLANGYLSYTEGDPQSTVTFSGFPINDGKWHHVAMVRNGEGGSNVTLYVDGDPVTTGTGSATSYLTYSINIGAWDDGLGTLDYFSGGIDELRVWDYALSEVEIESSLVGPKTGSEPNLRFYFDFNIGISGEDNTSFLALPLPDVSPNLSDGMYLGFSLTGTESNYLTSNAFDYSGPIFYVDANAVGGDGSSWEQAFTDLQLALQKAGPGDEIWVAAGNYFPSDFDQTISFVIPSGVSLYGGFNGTETSVSERDFEINVTVLDGNVPSTFGSFNIVNISGTGNNAVLDGFTITGADNQANPDAQDFGGGIKVTGGAQPTLANLIVSQNDCQLGAGMYVNNSEVTISGSLFFDNLAQSFGTGGAIYADLATLNISDTRFESNSAWDAGTIYLNVSQLNAASLSFIANQANGLDGGAIKAIDSDVEVVNGLFYGNIANTGGAIYANATSSPKLLNIVNSTFAEQTASTGRDIAVRSNGSAHSTQLYNSILWHSGQTGLLSLTNDGSNFDVQNSLVKDWDITNYNGFSATITASNVLTATDISPATDPFIDLLNDNVSIDETSAAVDFGNAALLPLDTPDLDKDANTVETIPYDLLGNARIDGLNPDAGAYEYQTPIADISIEFNGIEILTGSPTNPDYGTRLGSNDLFYGKNRVFTIHNSGTNTLNLTSVSVAGDADFSISVQPVSNTISPGTSETFQLSFVPAVAGPRSATITILSDDPDEGTYTFDVSGEGIIKTPGSHHALNFTGVEYATLPSNSWSEGDWITLEAWIKTSNSDVATVVIKGDGSNHRWALEISRNTIGSAALSVKSGSTEFVESTTNVADGNWHHLAGVFDNINKTLTLFVDGIEEGTGSYTVEPFNQSDDIYIGADPGLTSPFIGQIDEVRIWQGKRLQSDIRKFMTGKINEIITETEYLAAYLRFDEGTGSVVRNIAGFADATITGATWVVSGAPLGDFSNYSYAGNSVITSDLSPGSTIELNGGVGTIEGFHLYRVDTQPNVLDRPNGYGGFEATRYYGVFLVKPAGFTYEFKYNYGTNGNVTPNEANLELASRSGNDAVAWSDLPAAIVDTGSDNITISGQTANAEYIVGFTNTVPSDIALSNTFVPENTTLVGTLSATDPDNGEVHIFSLIAGTGDTDNALFNIAGNTLQFIVAPDFEIKSSFEILIQADDQHGGLFEEPFLVTVTDANEAPFLFTNVQGSLLQGGTLVIDNTLLEYTDQDLTDGPANLTYTITTATINGTVEFVADPGVPVSVFTQQNVNDGELVYIHDGTTNFSDSFNFDLADGGEDGVLPVTGSFDFIISAPSNNNPTDIDISNFSVPENTTPVGTLSVTDADGGDVHIFSLVAGLGDTDNASFTVAGTALSFVNAPDFEVKPSYNLRIRVDDQQGGIYDEAFVVTVNDINESPVISVNLGASLGQGGAFVVDNIHLQTQDPDVSDTPAALTYTITTPTVNGVIGFTADPGTAITSFTQEDVDNALVVYTHDNSATTTDLFEFSVADGLEDGVLELNGSFNFTISLAGNSLPTDIALSSTTVAENTTAVGTLSATDPDAGDTHLFTLVAGAGDTDNASFTIAGTTLSFANAPNFEVKNSYQLRIQADDQAGGLYEEAFTISVTDVNEAPVFVSQIFATAENNAAFQAQLVFNDPDANPTFAFQILSGNTSGTFAIDNAGLIVVANAAGLDFETMPQFNLMVEISDLTNTTTATVTINLSDVLEAPQALAADQLTAQSFRARWQPVAGAEGYRLEVATDELFANLLTGFAPLDLAGTESVVSGLYHSTKFFYRVVAYQGAQTTDYSEVITVLTQKSAELTADSTALVKIYDQMGGAAWVNSSGWKSAQVRGWFGVVVQGNRVTAVNLAENNLAGPFPALSGSELGGLKQLDLFGNQMTSIASTNLGALEVLDLASNQLDFASLEPFASVATFTYTPQADRFEQVEIVQERGEPIIFDRTIGGSANIYQWLKNDVAIPGATGATFEISFPTFAEEGTYLVQVTNTTLPGLTIKSRPITFKVSSLERDKLVLSAIYEATGGPNWTNGTNWNTDDLSTWFGITVTENRVTQVRLPNNGLNGEIPGELADLRRLEAIDLSGNSISSIPNLSTITALTELKLENNSLEFDDLEPNVSIQGITYSPQKPAGQAATHLKEVNSSFSLEMPIGGTSNQYQWYRNGAVVEGLVQQTLNIGTLNYGTMGSYELEITNGIVGGLTLRTEIQRVLATASLSGLINDKNQQVVAGATGVLLGVNVGAYDSTAVYTSGPDGTFQIPDVVLGDYLISSAQDLAVYIPTYYQSTVEWDSADVIELRDNLAGLTLSMQNIPLPLTPDDGDNTLSGVLEVDIPEAGRTLAKGRVKGAGVSVSRQRFRGKGTEDVFYELVAYAQTDENGEFQFNFLEDGTYRLNIQYPGVPMDPNSFIVFELGGGAGVEENAVAVNALVTPTGIVVSKVEETGIYLNYFKNLEVYPNPVANHITIRYEKLIKGRVEAELLNLEGQRLMHLELEKRQNSEIIWDVSKLNNGLYLLRFIDRADGGTNITTLRILVEK